MARLHQQPLLVFFLLVAISCSSTAVLAVRGTSSTPQQIRLAQGGDFSTVVVSWITPATTSSTIVQYGLTQQSLNLSATGITTSYQLGSYQSGEIHHTTLTHLSASTTYYYRCGSAAAWSSIFSFTTTPVVGPLSFPFVFALIGDLGQTQNSVDTINHVMSNTSVQLIQDVGDLSYADGDQPLWDTYGQMVQPLAATKFWMVASGNHEVESLTQSFLSYQHRYLMPSNSSGATDGNLYYSYNTGPSHVIILSTYVDYSASSNQYAWLQNDLAKVNRSLTPWLIVIMHAPWYNSNENHHLEAESMRVVMEPLLYKSQVDVVFSGHVHAYERCYQVYNFQPDPNGIVYINIGDGGNKEGLYDKWYPQPSWSAFRQAEYGHGILELFNTTHAFWTWHRDEDLEGQDADSTWIIRNA